MGGDKKDLTAEGTYICVADKQWLNVIFDM
jgi:hypothetical protein